ncbi:MAG: hypothetical protein ACYDCK_11900 [Thermoplasmatota archaeon]
MESRITVPTRQVADWMSRLAASGALVLDTGERTTTEEAVDAEAVLVVRYFDAIEVVAPAESA